MLPWGKDKILFSGIFYFDTMLTYLLVHVKAAMGIAFLLFMM
jgi:hypothetical protein